MPSIKSINTNQKGGALVELVLIFPVLLLVLLSTVNISSIIIESSVVVEASRHGSRSVSVASSSNPVPAWVSAISASTEDFIVCPEEIPTTATTAHQIARFTTCDYLSKYFSGSWSAEYAKWEVSSSITTATEAGVTFWYISTTLRPNSKRGLIDFYIPIIDLRPQNTAIFPLMFMGAGG